MFQLDAIPISSNSQYGTQEQNKGHNCKNSTARYEAPPMEKSLKFEELLVSVREALDQLPEHRRGKIPSTL
jgi:hypothetical protein